MAHTHTFFHHFSMSLPPPFCISSPLLFFQIPPPLWLMTDCSCTPWRWNFYMHTHTCDNHVCVVPIILSIKLLSVSPFYRFSYHLGGLFLYLPLHARLFLPAWVCTSLPPAKAFFLNVLEVFVTGFKNLERRKIMPLWQLALGTAFPTPTARYSSLQRPVSKKKRKSYPDKILGLGLWNSH